MSIELVVVLVTVVCIYLYHKHQVESGNEGIAPMQELLQNMDQCYGTNLTPLPKRPHPIVAKTRLTSSKFKKSKDMEEEIEPPIANQLPGTGVPLYIETIPIAAQDPQAPSASPEKPEGKNAPSEPPKPGQDQPPKAGQPEKAKESSLLQEVKSIEEVKKSKKSVSRSKKNKKKKKTASGKNSESKSKSDKKKKKKKRAKKSTQSGTSNLKQQGQS